MALVSKQQIKDGNELAIYSQAVPGGTIYNSLIMSGGIAQGNASIFTPIAAASPQRFMILTNAKSELGIPLTATAGTPAGAVGITRVEGTSLQLVGETTTANAKTNAAVFELNLPDTYVAGSNIPVTVNAVVTGAGTLTAASTTMTVKMFTEVNGVEALLPVTAAVQIPATIAADLSFTVTGTNLVPGQRVILELYLLVTSSAGSNTGFINSASIQA